MLFFSYARKGFSLGIRLQVYAGVLVVDMDNFHLMGKGKSICLSSWDHEKKEEGFRREFGFPPRYHHHGGWNPHYFIDRGPVRGGFGREANCGGKEKGGFRGIDGIGYEAIR